MGGHAESSRTSGLGLAIALLAALLAASPGPVTAGDGPVDVVRGLLADLASGKGDDVLVARIDGMALARRVFSRTWDGFDDAERAELGRVASLWAVQELRASLGPTRDPGEGKPAEATAGPFEGLADVGNLAAVAVPLSAKGEREKRVVTRWEFLVTKAAPPRIADWRTTSGEAFTGPMVESLREALGVASGSPLLFAWEQLARRPPPEDSLLYAPFPPPSPEWLTRDLPSLDLPVVPGAGDWGRHAVWDVAKWGPRIVVHCLANGSVMFRGDGRRSPHVAADLSSPDPDVAKRGRDALHAVLAAAAAPAIRNGSRESKIGLVVRADRSARWSTVHSVLLVAAEPDVGVSSVEFVAAGDSERAPRAVTVPDPAASVFVRLSAAPPEEEPPGGSDDAEPSGGTKPTGRPEPVDVVVSLFRRDAEDRARARTLVNVTGGFQALLPAGAWTGDVAKDRALAEATTAAFAPVVEALRAAAKRVAGGTPSAAVELPPPKGANVPAGDVLRAIQACGDAGFRVRRVEATE